MKNIIILPPMLITTIANGQISSERKAGLNISNLSGGEFRLEENHSR